MENGLDFLKAQKAGKCWSQNFLMLQHVDPDKGRQGLLDETPAPVVLTIQKINDQLVFEQTKDTRKYLA
jgi:hypothetical protein